MATPLLYVVGAALLIVDEAAVVRSILGNPDWPNSTDIGVYVAAARAIVQGVSPYDYANAPLSAYGAITIANPYMYPPAFAEALRPLLALGTTATRWIWFVATLACTLATIAVLSRGSTPKLRWPVTTVIAGVVCATASIRGGLYFGNADLLLIFLLVLALYGIASGRGAVGGVLLAVAFTVKPFLAILLPYLLWKRSWKAAAWAAATGAIVFLVSFIPVRQLGPGAVFLGWIDALRYESSPAFAAFPHNVSIQGLFQRLFIDNPFTIPWVDAPWLARALGSVVLIGSTIMFVRSVSRSSEIERTTTGDRASHVLAESGLVLALYCLASPLTEAGHLIFLVPGLVGILRLTVSQVSTVGRYRSRWIVTSVCWIALLVWQATGMSTPGLPADRDWYPIGGIAILATGLLAFVLIAATTSLAYALNAHAKEGRPVAWQESGKSLVPHVLSGGLAAWLSGPRRAAPAQTTASRGRARLPSPGA